MGTTKLNIINYSHIDLQFLLIAFKAGIQKEQFLKRNATLK